MFESPTKKRSRLSTASISVVAHLVLFVILTGVLRLPPKIAPYKLPGTKQGVRLLTYYAAGSPQQNTSDLVNKVNVAAKSQTHLRSVAAVPQPEKLAAPSVDRGTGSAAESGQGEGDISIALLKKFPHPSPDLSSLPHGTAGDVILNAVIDEHGNISELTLIKGLGKTVDDEVIAAVRQWTYNPAIKNGAPVPSEQELHFHYERG